MTTPELRILLEDNHLLAVDKIAGVLTMGDSTGDRTMVDLASDYLRIKYNKPGNVFVGVVHRLDRPVSGALLFARTSKAASRLSDQFRRGAAKKIYHAIVTGNVKQQSGTLTDSLLKDRNTNVVSVVDRDHPHGKLSTLKYEVTGQDQRGTHLRIEPLTGRSHQIRVQLAAREMPIRGDAKYGSQVKLNGRISLHAVSLEFEHPTRKERVRIESPVPDNL